jgi:hypothetical protein
MTGMDELVRWLREQLDDDEQVAQDAAWPSGHWKRDAISCVVDADTKALVIYGEGTPSSSQADHIVRWDPARALAEVDAKRRILDEAIRLMGYDGEFQFLEMLALPYADRAGYREEWRP